METQVKESLVEQLNIYNPFDKLEALQVQQLQQFLRESNNHYDRSNLLAHIVADAWIINPAHDHVVLVEHPLNNRWLAPGGHCEGNPNIFSSAVREAAEETGLKNLKPLFNKNIFDISTSEIRLHERNGVPVPPHLHFSVCFIFEAPENAPLTISEESNNIAWVPLHEIPEINFSPSHYRRPQKTRRIYNKR